MIEILKHGSTKFKTSCNNCGCEFTYTLMDLILAGVHCPDCGRWCCHAVTNAVAGSEKEDSNES